MSDLIVDEIEMLLNDGIVPPISLREDLVWHAGWDQAHLLDAEPIYVELTVMGRLDVLRKHVGYRFTLACAPEAQLAPNLPVERPPLAVAACPACLAIKRGRRAFCSSDPSNLRQTRPE